MKNFKKLNRMDMKSITGNGLLDILGPVLCPVTNTLITNQGGLLNPLTPLLQPVVSSLVNCIPPGA